MFDLLEANQNIPGLLEKATGNERGPKVLKKPVDKDREEDNSQKFANEPKCNFHGKSP